MARLKGEAGTYTAVRIDGLGRQQLSYLCSYYNTTISRYIRLVLNSDYSNYTDKCLIPYLDIALQNIPSEGKLFTVFFLLSAEDKRKISVLKKCHNVSQSWYLRLIIKREYDRLKTGYVCNMPDTKNNIRKQPKENKEQNKEDWRKSGYCMDYIADKALYKAVMFACDMIHKGTQNIYNAIAIAARYYGVDKQTVHSYVSQRSARSQTLQRNK